MSAEFIVKRIEDRLREEDKIEEYVKQLEKTKKRIEKDLAVMFSKANKDGKWSKAELYKYNRKRKLENQIKVEIQTYAKSFRKKLRDDLATEYKQQSLFVQDTISAATNQTFTKLPVQAIKTVAIDEAEIAGKKLKDYIVKFASDFQHRVTTEIFQGISLGENPEKVAKRLAKATNMPEARMKTTFRSWYNKILNSSSFDTYEQAGVKRAIYDATLDTRTTAICISRDSKIYPIEVIRLMLPAHYNCRTTGRPIIPGVEYDTSVSYKNWITDGRRSKEQLNKVGDKLDKSYKNDRIDKKEYKKIKNWLKKSSKAI